MVEDLLSYDKELCSNVLTLTFVLVKHEPTDVSLEGVGGASVCLVNMVASRTIPYGSDLRQ